ncbi:MAG: hypothetical protein ABIJ12_04385 [bacterium]
MDLLEIVRTHPKIVVGHKEVLESLNVRKELSRFLTDPLDVIMDQISVDDSIFLKGDIGRYLQSYSSYSLCLNRCLNHISLARKNRAVLHSHPKNKKYSIRQKQLASKRKDVGPYLELDYQDLIIHACILLDRTIALSRRFLTGNRLLDLPWR